MADGFSLNIDPKFMQDLDKAEKKIQDIAAASEKTSKAIIKNFQEATDKGVGYFLSQMRKANEQLLSFSNASKNVKIGDIGGLSSMNKMASQSTDIINKLVDALVRLSSEQSKSKSSSSKDSNVSKINSLYRERIKLMKQLEHFVQLGAKGITLTNEESSSISSIHQRLQVIDMEIKSYQKRTDLSKQAIRALIQGEADFSIAQGNEIRKRQKLVDDETRKKEDKVRQEALQNEKLASLDKKRAEDIVKRQQKELNDYRAYLKSKQDMYKRMFDQIAKQESQMRSKSYNRFQASGDTSNQATAAYNRLYGDNGIKSVNNMNRALQKLQDAQNKLNLNTDKGRQKYDELGKKIQQIKKDLDKATRANEKFHNSHSKLLNTSDQLQRKLALLFSVSAIQGYMNKLIEVRKEFELQQKSLQILLKDKDEADKLWQQTLDLAVKSPFRVKELVNYTKQLAAYRIETSKLHKTTKMLSDVSAGLGVDMQRIILAFGQVRAAQFLRGTELRQFTEAGIPMLDELANLFTELEGRAVSTGEVFERISKRMVLFKDVEQVFERMTSASGIFYKMQEEQSKTLAGMISNLHDSMDIMLNDIGKANEKNIKDLIQMTRTMIDNWRMIGVIIKEVGAAFLLFNLSKFAAGWRMAAGAIAMSDITMKGIAGTAGKLRVALSTLFSTIAANPFTAILTASGAAIYALWEYSESIAAVNKKYDEMSIREVNVIDKLEALNEKAQKNNTIIEKNKKGSEERNNAEKENLKILKEIKTKYPELANLVSKQTNGTIDLTKAIEAQNKKLIENIALQQKAKGGWFYDSLDENYKDAIEDFAELQSEINSIKVISAEAMAKLSQADISSEDYKKYSKLLAEIRKSKDFDSLQVAYNNFTKEVVRNGKEVTKQVPLLGMFAKQWLNVANASGSYKQAIKDLTQSFERQKDDLIVGITDAYNKAFNKEGHKNEDEAKEAGANAAGAWIEGFLDDFGVIDENIREWAKIEIPKFVTVDVLYPTKEDTPQELEDWAKRVKEAITKVNDEIKTKHPNATQFQLFPLPDKGQTREQYLNIAKSVLDIAKATYAEGQQIEDEATVNRTKMLSDYADDVEKILNIIKKETTKGAGKDWMSEVIKGVKEAHQEYLKLSKTLDSVEAKQMALDKYEGVFNEASKNANLGDIKLGDLTFETEEGAKDALRMLKDLLPESAKNARLKIEEALSEIEGEVRIKTKVEQDKQILDSIEEMFGSYEISLELQKLNIPPDLAKQLFNIDALTLPELKSKVVSMESKFVGTDMEEEYRKFLKKIDEMEEKAQMERLKNYSKYLIKAQSERVKIKLEEMRQLAEIEKLGFNETQKEQITQSIQLETKQKMDKAEWDAFKDTDLYVQMFEDLGVVSGNVLDDLQKRLVEMRGSLSNLSPQELKEVVAQLERVTSEQISRNPFENLGDTIDKGVKALKRLKDEQNAYNDALKEQESAQSTIDSLQISIEEAKNKQKEAKATLESSIATKEQKEQAMAVLATSALEIVNNEKLLDVEIKRLAAQKGITEEAAKKLILTRAEVSELNKTANSVGAWGSTITDSVSQVTSMLENWGIDFGEEFEGVLSGLGQAFGALESIDLTKPMSIISGVTGVVAGLGNAFASIFGFGNKDKKKEKQIQREIKFVEDLERAYKKLEKAIDNAYAIDTLQSSGKAAKDNLDAQISSYKRMIAAEEAKKKTDHDRIKEWQLAIEDLIEQKAELDKELVSVATSGIMDDVLSASQEFTNAWLEAFNETGDGLSGLKSNFKETMLEMVKQQAAMLISSTYIDKWKKQLEQYINPNDLELSTDEAKKWVNAVTTSLPQLNQALENYFTAMQQAGVDLGGQGELSGLQRGIQGVTEETAQIIEAYLNSIRFFVAEQNTYLSQIAASFGNAEVENPMVGQLRIIASQTTAINELLNSLTSGGHSMGGRGFRVFIS